MKKEGGNVEVTNKGSSKKNAKGSSKKSSSFSISRLTSPSPSSNSSGGSVSTSRSLNNNNVIPQHQGMTIESSGKRTSTSSPCSLGSSRKMPVMKGREKKGNSDSGSETGSGGGHGSKARSSVSSNNNSSCGGGVGGGSGSGSSSLCVDLRVSGRIWERSGVSAPPPRSIYKPLSAFHDPSDVNLTHSSQRRSPDSLGLPEPSASSPSTTTTKTLEEQQKMIVRDHSFLSTTYVLKNLTTIYQRVRGRAGSVPTQALAPINTPTTTPSPSVSGSVSALSSHQPHHYTATPINKKLQQKESRGSESSSTLSTNQTHTHHPRSPSTTPTINAHHTFNYSDSDECSNHDSNHSYPSHDNKGMMRDEERRKIDLVVDSLSSPSPPSQLSPPRDPDSDSRKIVSTSGEKVEIKIPFPRPIKVQPNYSNNGASTTSRDFSSTSRGKSPTPSLGSDGEVDRKYTPRTHPHNRNPSNMSENEEEEEEEDTTSDDIVHVLSDETENEDEPMDSRKEAENDKEY